MHSLDVICCTPEVEVYAPECCAKGVGETWAPLVVERVSFAQDEGEVGLDVVWQSGEVAGFVQLLRN